jgi:hypothetical protein
MEAKQAPLIERLKKVPADARLIYEHDQFHSQSIPVGALCAEATSLIEQLRNALAESAASLEEKELT